MTERSQSVKLNEQQDREIDLPCSECSGKTCHKILVSADLHGSEGDGQWSVDWLERNQIVQCQGCKTISFRRESSNSEDWEEIDDRGTISYNKIEALFPPRLDSSPTLARDSYALPFDVKRVYDETVLAIQNQSTVLAGMGLRALVEAVCKQCQANGKNLPLKIDSLVSMQVLTPNGAKILHNIRALGNEAAHEIKPQSERQLMIALNTIEHVLREVYIIPHIVDGFGA
jgi:hypothetical protein